FRRQQRRWPCRPARSGRFPRHVWQARGRSGIPVVLRLLCGRLGGHRRLGPVSAPVWPVGPCLRELRQLNVCHWLPRRPLPPRSFVMNWFRFTRGNRRWVAKPTRTNDQYLKTYRPRFDTLEERLPPGDTVLGGLLAAWWAGSASAPFITPADSLPA